MYRFWLSFFVFVVPLLAFHGLHAYAGKPGFTVAQSGLQSKDITVGRGDSSDEARPGQVVKVHYVGTLENGVQFDSSRSRGQPFVFELGRGRVIEGWEQGVVGMKPGGVRKLIIPSHLAYGDQDLGRIPPNSTLYFEIELISTTG